MQFFNDEDFSWRVLAVEAVVIMLSVLLGFVLNGWRQSRGEQKTVDAALESIAREAQQNKNTLDRRLPYYQSTSAALDSLAQTSEQRVPADSAYSRVSSFRGFRVGLLRGSSYQLATDSGALSHMDYDLADLISNAYALQNFYDDIRKRTLSAALNNNLEGVSELASLFDTWSNIGQQLQSKYDDMLDRFEERGIVSPDAVRAGSTARAAR